MSEDLKPCPFCGSPAELCSPDHEIEVHCTNCAAKVENAPEFWNTRAETPQSIPSEREEIVKWLRDLNARDNSHNYYFVLANRIERGDHLTRQALEQGSAE